jgi:hypothetical protein
MWRIKLKRINFSTRVTLRSPDEIHLHSCHHSAYRPRTHSQHKCINTSNSPQIATPHRNQLLKSKYFNTIYYIQFNMVSSTPKRILLLGASKHIGYHVLEQLAPESDKYTLFVLARSASSTITPFKGKENITFIQGDAKDQTTMEKVISSTMNGQVDFIVSTVGTSIPYHPNIRK